MEEEIGVVNAANSGQQTTHCHTSDYFHISRWRDPEQMDIRCTYHLPMPRDNAIQFTCFLWQWLDDCPQTRTYPTRVLLSHFLNWNNSVTLNLEAVFSFEIWQTERLKEAEALRNKTSRYAFFARCRRSKVFPVFAKPLKPPTKFLSNSMSILYNEILSRWFLFRSVPL